MHPDYRDPKARHRFANAVHRAARDAGEPRGPGRKLTDIELLAHIAEVQRDMPDATKRGELEYAWWVLGIEVSQDVWFRAWDRIADPVRKRGQERA